MKRLLMWAYGKQRGFFLTYSVAFWGIGVMLGVIISFYKGINDIIIPFLVSLAFFIVVLPLTIFLLGREFIVRAADCSHKIVEIDPCGPLIFGDYLWKRSRCTYAQIKDAVNEDGSFSVDIPIKGSLMANITVELTIKKRVGQEKDYLYYREIYILGNPWDRLQKQIKDNFLEKKQEIKSLLEESYLTSNHSDAVCGIIQAQIICLVPTYNPYHIAEAEVRVGPIKIKNILIPVC